ncbi:MAG: radical SAM protein [Marinilabiliaceae bacterium]|nr:radical SAM protein [Marinilabiliaceae bacterium]
MSHKVLLITPPFTQLNTAYPATAYLKGYLNTLKIESVQADLGIEVINKLFSRSGLTGLFDQIDVAPADLSSNSQRILNLRKEYLNTVDAVMDFLRGNNDLLAHAICEGNLLPEASRFNQVEDLDWSFGTMGLQDKAKHLTTLYLEDLSDLIQEAIDPFFGFSRYAERLGRSASSFDEMNQALLEAPTYIDQLLIDLLKEKIESYQPTLIALSVPFPGNLYSALRCGQYIKKQYPHIHVTMGGGYVNTELRELKEPRVFSYVDFMTLDDGEAPLRILLEVLDGKRDQAQLKRTFFRNNAEVIYCDGSDQRDVPQAQTGTPDYSDLRWDLYLSVVEVANPMFRLWSDGRWNKMTLAHGCYWGKCTFCDGSLDYIGRYEPNKIEHLVDRMEAIIQQTGRNGFHFVDEAAPPVLLRELALELLRRNLLVTWWTNIRFEKSYTRDLCLLLKESGCIAVSGGLEVASDRLLQLINKGVTVEQVTRVADHFTQSGIMVHAYLMYGFPTQTAQETIDALEVVRQLFEAGVLHSGFWHRFAMTAHSDVGLHPEKYKVQNLTNDKGTFANNDLEHADPSGAMHEMYGDGLRKSLYNFMHGLCFDYQIQDWFDFKVPRTTIPSNCIERSLTSEEGNVLADKNKWIWLGNQPRVRSYTKKKKGKTTHMMELTISNKKAELVLKVKEELGQWLCQLLPQLAVSAKEHFTLQQVRADFEQKKPGDFNIFINSYTFSQLRDSGLVIL